MIFPRLDSIATRNVIILDGHATVDLALQAMCTHHIRDVVVRLEAGAYRILLATDLGDCQGTDYTTRLDQLPLQPLPTQPPEASAMDGIEALRAGAGEYLGLLGDEGRLCGIVSYSDLLASIDPESLAQTRRLGDLLAGAHIVRADAGVAASTVLRQMRESHQSAVLIESDGQPRGIFTRSDVVRLLAARQSLERPIGELINHPLVTVPEHCSVQQALAFCREHGIKRVVVSDEHGGVVAIITARELVSLFYNRWIDFMREQEAQLRDSNADLEQFAYSVSHDMRQPLRMVSGHLQLLARALEGQLDGEARESLEFALDGARRMDAMIVSLLDYSRVGRKTQPKQRVASREALDEALRFLEPEIDEREAQVTVEGGWPQVHASLDELSRLLQNLIGNAIKYHDKRRPIEVRVTSAVVDERWQVVVEDNGIGIEPAQLPRLFRFFSRLHASDRYPGTGMGLALCRRIVEHHGGTLRAESEGSGRGSRFIFELPLGGGAHG